MREFRYPDNLEAAPTIGLWQVTDALLLLFAGVISIFIYVYGRLFIPIVATAVYGFASARWGANSQSVIKYLRILCAYLFSARDWEMFDSSAWFTPSRMNVEIHYRTDKEPQVKKDTTRNISLKDAAAQSEKGSEKKTFGQFLAENSGSVALILIILFGGGWLLMQMAFSSARNARSVQSSRPITAIETASPTAESESYTEPSAEPDASPSASPSADTEQTAEQAASAAAEENTAESGR